MDFDGQDLGCQSTHVEFYTIDGISYTESKIDIHVFVNTFINCL